VIALYDIRYDAQQRATPRVGKRRFKGEYDRHAGSSTDAAGHARSAGSATPTAKEKEHKRITQPSTAAAAYDFCAIK
jgi:hypothetical protein